MVVFRPPLQAGGSPDVSVECLLYSVYHLTLSQSQIWPEPTRLSHSHKPFVQFVQLVKL